MSESFGEFVKWVVVGVIIISVYNLVSEKDKKSEIVQKTKVSNIPKVTIVINDQAATTFYKW